MLPEKKHSYYNPSFVFLPDKTEYHFGRRLPLGILSLFILPDRNPLFYYTDPETFRNEFDLLSMYDQLNYPTVLLLRPARSPEEIIVHVHADSLTIGDGEGKPLVFEEAGGSAGISKPFSPLIPPPALSYRITRGQLHSETGLFLASTGHSLDPGRNLRKVLEGEPVEPQTSYNFSAAASASGGISTSLSYRLKMGEGKEYMLIVPRVLAYYRAFMGEALYSFEITTDDLGAVQKIGGEESLFISRPGDGWGAGGRFDVGSSIVYGDFTLGFALLNVLGYDRVTGDQVFGTDSAETESKVHSSFGPDPKATAAASYLWETYSLSSSGTTQILASADAVIGGGYSSHLSVTLLHKSLMFRLLAGYKGGWETAATAGLRRGKRRVALTLSLHSSPFTHRPVPGIGLQVRFLR